MKTLTPEVAAHIKALEEKSGKLQAEIDKLQQQNFNLTEILIKSQKKMFDKSSEQKKYIDGSEQLSLFSEAEKEYAATAPELAKETLIAAHTRHTVRQGG